VAHMTHIQLHSKPVAVRWQARDWTECSERAKLKPDYVSHVPQKHIDHVTEPQLELAQQQRQGSPSGDVDHAVMCQLCDSSHQGGLLPRALAGCAGEHGGGLASLQGRM
jgi:hypothetical protein